MRKKIITAGLITSLFISIAVADSKQAQRLVVMDFGALDTLTELGAKDKIVGLPKGNTPEYLVQYNDACYSSVGGMKAPDLTVIKDLTPDGIIISGRQASFYDALAAIAPVTHYNIAGEDYLASVKKNILALGAMVGEEKRAEEKWIALEQRIETTRNDNKNKPERALVILHNAGKILASQSGYAHFVHDILGIKKADEALSNERVEVDTAYLVKIMPDIIYIIDRSAAIGVEPMQLAYFSQEALQAIPAIRNKKVIYLTPKLWYLSGNGLQSIPLQIDEIIQAL